MKYKDIVNESGQLTDEGKKLFDSHLEIDNILSIAHSEAEIRTLGSIISSHIGNLVSFKVSEFILKGNLLWKMTDDEFEQFIKNKYPSLFISMTEEEVERFDPIAKKRMENVNEEIRKSLAELPLPHGVNFR